mmetsp:Transcript_34128/g.74812  ORF Transcript_34128/g.74812 Transcript_34128/m.74812 type:complete len:271 (+) Transcript_34128:93-905(+)
MLCSSIASDIPCRGISCCLGCEKASYLDWSSSFHNDDNYGENIEVGYSIKRRKVTIISSDIDDAISCVVELYHDDCREEEEEDAGEENKGNGASKDDAASRVIKKVNSAASRSKSMVSDTSKRVSRLGLAPSFASRSVGAVRMRSRTGIKRKNAKDYSQASRMKSHRSILIDTTSSTTPTRGRTRGRSTQPRSRSSPRSVCTRTISSDSRHSDRPLPSHRQVQATSRKKRPRSSSSMAGSLASSIAGGSINGRIKRSSLRSRHNTRTRSR